VRLGLIATCLPFRSSIHILALLVCIAFSPQREVLADVVQSIQDGSWNVGGTWVGGQVPRSDDSVIISDSIEISEQVAANSLSLTDGGRLTLKPHSRLSLFAGGSIQGATLVLESGSTLELFGILSMRGTSLLDARCVDPAWCTIQSPNSSGSIDLYPGAQLLGQYVEMEKLGNSSLPAISLRHPVTLFLERVRFSSGGSVTSINSIPTPTEVIQILNSTWRSTQSPVAFSSSGWNRLTSGTRLLRGNVFDKPIRLFPPTDFSLEGNYFQLGYEVSRGPWRSFSGNLVRHLGTNGGLLVESNTKDNYWIVDNPQIANPHFLWAGPPPTVDIDGDIFEFTGTNGDGDCLLVSSETQPVHISLRNSIVLPNAGDENSGTLFSALGGPGVTLYVEHNTYFTGSQGAAVGETYKGHPGQIASFRSNIAWNKDPQRGAMILSYTPLADVVTPGGLSHNAAFRVASKFQHLIFSSPVDQSADLNLDPQFMDKERKIAKWDSSLSGPGTVQHALAELSKKNDPGNASTNYQIANLIRYVRQGFYPTNPVFSGSAHDGTTRGAVQDASGATLSGPPPTPHVTPVPNTPPPSSPGQPQQSSDITVVDPSTGIIIAWLPPIVAGSVGDFVTQPSTDQVTCGKSKRKSCRRRKMRISLKCKCKKRRHRR
jgi:hypothetical protein